MSIEQEAVIPPRTLETKLFSRIIAFRFKCSVLWPIAKTAQIISVQLFPDCIVHLHQFTELKTSSGDY